MAFKTQQEIDFGFIKCLIDGVLSQWQLLLRSPVSQPAMVATGRSRVSVLPSVLSGAGGATGNMARRLEHYCSCLIRPDAAHLPARSG
ncbi:MAG: hypothetical protein WBF93_03930 [Pirellulales bacterium]|jgi:hypothetical protein|nr:hypothetical protein [Pirellulales bacterium]